MDLIITNVRDQKKEDLLWTVINDMKWTKEELRFAMKLSISVTQLILSGSQHGSSGNIQIGQVISLMTSYIHVIENSFMG